MKTIFSLACLLLVGAVSDAARADDWILSPSPVARTSYYVGTPAVVSTPVTTYYSSSAVVSPAPVVSTPAPVTSYYAPTTTYYAPSTSYYAPSVVSTPAPVTTYYAPSVVAPAVAAPRMTYYSPSVRYYAPATVVAPTPTVTYYGSTTGIPVTTFYAPATTMVAPVYATPGVVSSKVYYPGQPVRNFFKAITP